MQTGKLLSNIESIVVKGRVYGVCNEEVKIVFDNGNVVIVENNEGNRYPVKRELIEIKTIEIKS